MNQKEKEFVESIEKKIGYYKIGTTFDEAIERSVDTFTETNYNDGTSETIDVGIERFLCEKSPWYFIDKYAWIDFPGVGVIPFKPYYFQSNILMDLMTFKKVVAEKVRQCLTEDNFVMTNRGYISIKDVKIGDEIETIINGSSTFVKVQDSFYTGKKEVCRILINSGLTIDCTLDHKIFTKRGWIKAEELTLKDEIVSIINKGKFGNFELENDKFAAFIGFYVADGRYNSPSFVNTNLDYLNEMLEIGQLFENCEPYLYERKEDKTRKKAYDLKLVSKNKKSKLYRPIKDFMHRFGLNIISKDRCLTNELMNLNERQMSILLNRLYAGDGWITYKRKLNQVHYEVGLGSPSHKLIKQIEYILQTKYGIHCYIMECFDKRNKSGNRFWKLRISQKKSVIEFINKIGIKGKTDTENIINLICKENPYNDNQSFEKIRKIIRKEGVCDVYDITTESSDFITNGLLVHNCGLSTLFALYCLWRLNFKEAEDIDIVSLKQLKAQAFVAKMNSTIKYLPLFLKTRKTKDNEQVLEFENGSKIISESQSENAGRSDTLSLLVLDEAAHYRSEKMVRGIVSAAQPTLSRTNGQFIILSTPNRTSGPGSYYYEQVNQARLNTEENAKLVSVDWWEVPDDVRVEGPQKGFNQILKRYIERNYYKYEDVKQEARSFFMPVQENWRDNPWLKKQHDDLGEILFKQEVLHSFIVGGNAVFSEEVLKNVELRIKEPVEKNKLGTIRADGVWIWKKPEPNHRYIVGVDISSGTGAETSAFQIMDAANYEQVCEYKGMIATKNFGILVKNAASYYNQAFVVIECNGIGEAVFNEVYYHDTEPYNNVFKQKKTKNNITRMTGWITDTKTRKLITNELIDWMTVDTLFEEFKIYSKRIYLEMTTWIWDGAKPVHDSGATDDALLSLSLALYLRDKATTTGESFLINEKGEFVEYDPGKDNNGIIIDTKGKFDFVSTDDKDDDGAYDDDYYKKHYGCGKEEYQWLVGSK